MGFWLRDVSAAMRTEGWTMGAALLERWFRGGAWTMSDAIKSGQVSPETLQASQVSDGTVTMDWVLRFARARAAHDRLLETFAVGDRRARTAARARELVRAWQRTRALPPDRPFRFGDLGASQARIDTTCQLNLQVVNSGLLDPIDDFFAAIANASIKVAVSGMVERVRPDLLRLRIDEIGTYLRDTYDFNGDQPLGSWGENGFSRLAVAAPECAWRREDAPSDAWYNSGRYFSVTNETFRKYRTAQGAGGDFLIFSDVRRFCPAQEIVLEFAP
jgi:hypothetical protein